MAVINVSIRISHSLKCSAWAFMAVINVSIRISHSLKCSAWVFMAVINVSKRDLPQSEMQRVGVYGSYKRVYVHKGGMK